VYITWCQVSDNKWRKCITIIQQKQAKKKRDEESTEAANRNVKSNSEHSTARKKQCRFVEYKYTATKTDKCHRRRHCRKFQRSWENYLKASGLSKRANDEQIAVLMTAVGDEAFKRFPNFNIEDEDQQTAEKVLTAIGRNLTPQVNKRYERAVFNLAKQEENEKYVDYFNRLRTLLKNCQYGTLEDDLLLDKIICSIKDTSLRERLWMDRNITLDQAIDKCKAKELSQQQLRNIEESNDEVKKFQKRTEDKNNSKNFREPNSKRQGKECKYCGYTHEPGKCPAKGVICKKCSKKDHYARVCYSKGKNTVKEIGSEREENEEDILNITTRNSKQINTELDFIINDEIIKVSC
jgi:hypothetical protein